MSTLAFTDATTFAPTLSVILNGTPTPTDVTRSITSATVIAEPTALDHATVVVANPYPALRFTHGADAGLFREGSGIVVQIGYLDASSALFDGEITCITPSFPASGVPTLAVEAQSRLFRLASPPQSHTYSQVTDAAVAEMIAQRNGLTAAAVPTTEVHDSLVQMHKTDLEFLRSRADEIGYEVVTEGLTLNFRPRADDTPPEFVLVWGDPQLATQDGSYPLESFEPRLNARAPVTSVEVRGLDPLTRDLIKGTAQTGSEDVPAGSGMSAAQVTQAAFGSDDLVVVNRPILTQEQADTAARAIYNDRALGLVQATGTTVGIPDLRPGTVVQVAGVGIRFSGGYYLTRVTHRIGPGGYLTSFTASSSVVGAI